jgi:septum formation protein
MTIQTAVSDLIVLASASPRRRELLANIGIRPAIDPSTSPEPERKPKESPASYAVRAARGKAAEVAPRHPGCIILGADTIVVVGNRILGKPEDREHARQMLQILGGRWHRVITGICLTDSRTGKMKAAAEISRVHMRRLSNADIEWYLTTGEYHDKAGAYAIQGFASLFIDKIEGCYFNIVGFPIFTFANLLRRFES